MARGDIRARPYCYCMGGAQYLAYLHERGSCLHMMGGAQLCNFDERGSSFNRHGHGPLVQLHPEPVSRKGKETKTKQNKKQIKDIRIRRSPDYAKCTPGAPRSRSTPLPLNSHIPFWTF